MPEPKCLERIIKKYPPESGKRSKCAQAIFTLFQKEGVNAQIERIETHAPFLSTRSGIQLSFRIGNDLAYHEFVQVGDIIYDALTGMDGLNWETYQQLFYAGVFDDGTVWVTYLETK